MEVYKGAYRVGRFTSSKIYALLTKNRKGDGFGAPALTYIAEKNYEFKLGRSLSTDTYSRSIYWGHLMEYICYEQLGLEYDLVSSEHRDHPDDEFMAYWAGTPDVEIKGKLIGEIKSYQLKKFAEYAECLQQCNMEGSPMMLRDKFSQEYWQIVSNCIINNVPEGEAIAFMPTKDLLESVRERLENTDLIESLGLDPWKLRFVVEDEINNLPYLENEFYFDSLTRYRFKVPEEDKTALTEAVREAKKYLIKH